MSEHLLCKKSDIPSGHCRQVIIDDDPIAVFNLNGEFYAIADVCSHAHAYLSEGQILDCKVVCPLHGAEFDIKTGKALKMPAVAPVQTYPVRVDGDDLVLIV